MGHGCIVGGAVVSAQWPVGPGDNGPVGGRIAAVGTDDEVVEPVAIDVADGDARAVVVGEEPLERGVERRDPGEWGH